jgi:hypothetical protein
MPLDAATIADTQMVRGLALSYAHYADRRQPDRLAALFEPDGMLRMIRRDDDGRPPESRGRSEISKAVARLRRFEATFHLVANHTIDITGDDATGEVYCVAHHVSADVDGRTDQVMYIRYQDRYRRHGEEWLFAERELHVDWTEKRVLGPPA